MQSPEHKVIIGDRPEPANPEEARRPVPVDFWPGEYVILSLAAWRRVELVLHAHPEDSEPLRGDLDLQQLEVPDTGPRVCPYCKMDFWTHRSRCRMLFNDPNDPDAEY